VNSLGPQRVLDRRRARSGGRRKRKPRFVTDEAEPEKEEAKAFTCAFAGAHEERLKKARETRSQYCKQVLASGPLDRSDLFQKTSDSGPALRDRSLLAFSQRVRG